MRIRLRTLFLITTVVAIVAFTFTLGISEGIVTAMFFACIFGPSKKDRWKYCLVIVFTVVWMGIYSRHKFSTHVPGLNYSYSACVDIVFTGFCVRHQEEVLQFLESKPPFNNASLFSARSLATLSPFFHLGIVKLSFDEEKLVDKNLAEIETEVRRKLAKGFPNLSVTIEGHSVTSKKQKVGRNKR